MNDISELDQEAQWLRVSWRKANNYYSAFAVKLLDNKKKFDGNMYPGWTFAMWLGQKAGLGEDQVMKQLKNFTNVIAAEERDKIIAANQRLELEQRAAKIAAAKERNEQIEAKRRLDAEAKVIKEVSKKEKEDNKKKANRSIGARKAAETKKAKLAAFKPDDSKDLDELAKNIQAGEIKMKRGRQDFVDGMMMICIAMATARKQCGNDDMKFNKWMNDNHIEYNKNDRAAYINMGLVSDETRKVLEQTDRLSPQLIWEKELKPNSNVISIA